jgi:hypothetical protein
VCGTIVPFCAFATWELGLPWPSFFFIAAGGAVVLVYGLLLRFFVTELIVTPVVEDVAAEPPEARDRRRRADHRRDARAPVRRARRLDRAAGDAAAGQARRRSPVRAEGLQILLRE